MLTPKVGDTVIMKGVVSRLYGDDGFCFEDASNKFSSPYINNARIVEIISTPVIPKVGDIVWWDFIYNTAGQIQYSSSSSHGSELIHIHQKDNRKWAVVAYEGDLPRSIPFDKIRVTRNVEA